ncbi:ATP-binding protein [Raineya sp.]|jgi:Na+/proline symporter/signal transduction histidine kinase
MVTLLIIVSLLYLLLLFGLAYWAERKAEQKSRFINSPYIYALSLAVYCTAWTYYGSIGRASKTGYDFLLIYLGPTLSMPLWWFVMRKIIRIAKIQNIFSLADLIATRYGKNVSLGAIVSIFTVLGVVPYLALQIKAISETFTLLVDYPKHFAQNPVFLDYGFYITLALAIFTIYFGTRSLDLTRKNEGMVFAIAFESIFKLLAFLVAGAYVVFGLFDGFGDIFRKAFEKPELQKILYFQENATHQGWEWFLIGLASLFAVMFLPRQFQMAVVENKSEKHLEKAIWLFPLYLLIINVFVLPVALAGKLTFGSGIDADTYILAFPLQNSNHFLALLTYLGGFAAATSMLIVASLALSLMLTNNLFIPLSLRAGITKYLKDKQWGGWVLLIRRISIGLVLILAYWYLYTAFELPLVSIGLISFVAVSQFAPAVIGGLYWKEATRKGALAGIVLGFVVWFYTLIVPNFVEAGLLSKSIMQEGLFGVKWLRPQSLFGLEFLPVAHSLFWSLFFNIVAYVAVSVFTSQNSQERNQAELFVDVFKYADSYDEAVIWKGIAHKKDLEELLARFVGENKAKNLLNEFEQENQGKLYADEAERNAKLVKYAEKILATAIGSTSARILVASVVQEETLTQEEVLKILKETQELKKLNFELKKADALKNEFISTVTHELKTPITSIRSLSEILYENPDLEPAQREHFLKTVISETERMERLINQVLELEKFESGKQKLHLAPQNLNEIVKEAIGIYESVIAEKKIQFSTQLSQEPLWSEVDKDRILQVILNFLSNAVKFAKTKIVVSSYSKQNFIEIAVSDDGKGVPNELKDAIFEKFFQAENQNIRKPKGSGLGLAISKKIIQYHKGSIGVEQEQGMTKFYFRLFRTLSLDLFETSNDNITILKPTT